jgi:hypothetical protein
MSQWNDFKGDEATPHDRRLLLITQPQTFDAAEEHIYDVVVGYWNASSRAFVAAYGPSNPRNGQTLRVFKWAYLPELPAVTLRDQVGLQQSIVRS